MTLILLSLNLVSTTHGVVTEDAGIENASSVTTSSKSSSYLSGAKGVNDPSWNYENHGTDWDFLNCNVTTASATKNGVQAPLAINTTNEHLNDWGRVPVSFLTSWKAGSIKAEDHGVTNYTYRINATDGNLGIFYAAEAYFSPASIEWEVEQIRFKYPSEHTIDGNHYDLEM